MAPCAFRNPKNCDFLPTTIARPVLRVMFRKHTAVEFLRQKADVTGCMPEALSVQVHSILLSQQNVFLLVFETERAVPIRCHIISTASGVAVHRP